ncbi:two-component system regulatory protein YycI [Sporolactobacillus kofuensis]|uniref:Two-component system regulatory protein YycI n=1 Tax=Sporolactobacillus kofuensis TaxID=269672 RepID=A0ABW1WCU0_9BACL|nr:two-component system regulatory protein YycI [Sporolactobacillus kofuensis]MCO7175241.1 two-component system regulatory protein YycI [Sporolactobacillus kofuensis]
MNWSRTKSIFIICFLLLDVFLVFEMYMRQQDESIEGLHDEKRQYNYKIDTVMPTLPKDVTFLRGTRINFTQKKEAISGLSTGDIVSGKQKMTVNENGQQLTGTFAKPLALGDINNEDVQKNLLAKVYQGQDYIYWQSADDKSSLKFVQLYQSRPVFISSRNKTQMLDFTVRNKQVTGFHQSYLKLSSNKHSHVDLIEASQAINYLADRTDLVGYNLLHIKAIQLCYVNTVGDESAEPLIFVPAWHIVVHTVSGTTDYFINAVSGNVQSIN